MRAISPSWLIIAGVYTENAITSSILIFTGNVTPCFHLEFDSLTDPRSFRPFWSELPEIFLISIFYAVRPSSVRPSVRPSGIIGFWVPPPHPLKGGPPPPFLEHLSGIYIYTWASATPERAGGGRGTKVGKCVSEEI